MQNISILFINSTFPLKSPSYKLYIALCLLFLHTSFYFCKPLQRFLKYMVTYTPTEIRTYIVISYEINLYIHHNSIHLTLSHYPTTSPLHLRIIQQYFSLPLSFAHTSMRLYSSVDRILSAHCLFFCFNSTAIITCVLQITVNRHDVQLYNRYLLTTAYKHLLICDKLFSRNCSSIQIIQKNLGLFYINIPRQFSKFSLRQVIFILSQCLCAFYSAVSQSAVCTPNYGAISCIICFFPT